MLRSALSPDAIPKRNRPCEICCTDAQADAATAGWRVHGFDTVIAKSGRVVCTAANVISVKHSAHSDCESPHVSMSNPAPSAACNHFRYSVKSRTVVPVPKRIWVIVAPSGIVR